MASGAIPTPTPEQQKKLESLCGLPFVCLSLNPNHQLRVVGNFVDGSPVRINYVENLWNGALIFDAMESSGAWRRTIATGPELQVLAIAERLFGVTLEQALPIFLLLEKTEGVNFDNRPRKIWPRPVVN